MRILCDLHTHSTASDGRLSPADLVMLADRRRLAAVALTDHDTLDGLSAAAEAAEAFADLTFIGGIELSAQSTASQTHILGLHIDPADATLGALARRMRQSRERRNPQIVERLNELGIEITMDEVLAAAGNGPVETRVVARPHIAAVLTAKGYVRDGREAFNKYLKPGTPAYVSRERPAPAEAIAAIHAAGGVAILAHPVHLRCENHAQIERIIRSLKVVGLDGIEAYHSDQKPVLTRFLLTLARRLDLIVTGGSDFHGRPDVAVRLGLPRVPASVLAPLAARAEAVRARQ